MPDILPNNNGPGVASLVGGLIEDTRTLIRQEVALARRELQDEWTKAKEATAMLSAAVAACGLAGVLLSFCVVYAINLALPLWASFLIVGAAYALIGGVLLGVGITKINEVRLVPPQTTESVRQDVRAVSAVVAQPGPYVRR